MNRRFAVLTERVTIKNTSEAQNLSWALGCTFSIPSVIAQNPEIMVPHDGGYLLTGRQYPSTAHIGLREMRAYTEQKPMSSKVPISYQYVPTPLRNLIARSIGYVQRNRINRWGAYPAWPLDLSADFLADLCGKVSFYTGTKTPVVLSHDLDTSEGLENCVRQFLPLEERYGARSVSFLVPASWPIDYGLIRELIGRGHALGVHGFDHANKTAYCTEKEIHDRLQKGIARLKEYGAFGYRAPSLIRTRSLLRCLEHYYQYDSSIPTSGGLFPVPNNGCASARPYRIGSTLWELPLSMPREAALYFLGYKPEEVLAIWINCAKKISESGGVIVLLTHCEKRFTAAPRMFAIYEQFLEYLTQSGQYDWSTPEELFQGMAANG